MCGSNRSYLQKLATMVDDMKIIPEERKICSTCIQEKQTKLPHNETRVRARKPLELIHSDVFGPITPTSYDGKRYLVTFIDDFTHFTVCYTMESKSCVYQCFRKYESMVTTLFSSKIKRFRCDNGREYLSNEMKEYFEKQGIQFEFTVPYTPQQNGVAERMNRTIAERARCMLLHANVSKNLWSEAVMAAVYVINRCPTTALKNVLPATLWFGRRQKLDKLKIFGSKAYLHVSKQKQKGKFESRSNFV